MVQIPTPDELREKMVTVLAGATGRPSAYWDRRIGELVRLDILRNPRTNWALTKPVGSAGDKNAVHQAAELIGIEDPYVRW